MNLTNLINQMYHTLKLFNTGQITLPKIWRDKFPTKHFIAEETDDGLLIKPIITMEKDKDIISYEKKGETGLIFPKGIDPQVLIDKIIEIDG